MGTFVAVITLLVIAPAAALPSGYAPGWNGQAKTPSMGWRSWNAFHADIDQQLLEDMIDALLSKNRTVAGKPTSLYDAGFKRFGIDEGWEGCGLGVNGTQHAADGTPVIDTHKFPDMAGLVKYAHDREVLIGWYLNGCACGEHQEKLINYQGDVRSLSAFGFDAVKIDDCGMQKNMSLYAELMKQTGKTYEIEDCHWGLCAPEDDRSSCPTAEWCPFNHYRTSFDINSSERSWLANLQTTRKFQDAAAPLSVPHCWAYPDMLEVGLLATYELNRAHFGAWCVVSSPLILGLDLRAGNSKAIDSVWDLLTNQEAIAVNQAWAGHPGAEVKTWDFTHPPPPDAAGFVAYNVSLSAGNDLYNATMGVAEAEQWCSERAACLGFTYERGEARPHMYFKTAEIQMNTDAKWVSQIKKAWAPVNTTDLAQVWAKPLPDGALAVLFLNMRRAQTAPIAFNVSFTDLGVEQETMNVRCLWRHKVLPPAAAFLTTDPVPAGDSRFLKLTPVSHQGRRSSPRLERVIGVGSMHYHKEGTQLDSM